MLTLRRRQRLRAGARQGEGQADSQVLQVNGERRVEQVHLQTDFTEKNKSSQRQNRELLPANRKQVIVPSCSTGWMTCLCFMSFKSLSRSFWKEAIVSARLSALGLDGSKSELRSSLMSNRSPPSGESAAL